ncbi:MAG: hypothetical protein ACKVW3_06870 [Phycisphaerales bacterium]
MAKRTIPAAALGMPPRDLLGVRHRLTGLGRVPAPAGEVPADPQRPGDRRDEPPKRRKDERPPRYRPELLCRTFAGDLGARPIVDPNLVFWESPDIWIEGPSGDPDVATPGQNNTVKVHVWNNGLADCWAATIDLFWCDPSVGVSPAAAHPIGSVTAPVYAGQDYVASFNWTPSMANGAHECLVAQVYEPLMDPLVAPFMPKLDRHVAQRNISVIEAAPGAMVMLPFTVPNLTISAARSSLRVERLTGASLATLGSVLNLRATAARPGNAGIRELARENLEQPAYTRAAATEFRSGQTIRSGDLRDLRTGMMLAAKAAAVASVPRASGRTRPLKPQSDGLRPSHDVDLRPAQIARVAFQAEVPARARRGTVQAYRVVERVEGEITGGVTVFVKVR